MEENLFNQRQSYEKSELRADSLDKNPMDFFKKWYDEVQQIEKELENNAMTLGTINEQGFPKNRVVLLKRFSSSGFVFYTNYTSEKGRSLLGNPKTSLAFYWPRLERQVIVIGEAEKLSAQESDEYFAVRPRGSQIGAWVSHQSQPIVDRHVLDERQKELEKKYDGQPIPRPPFWGGFLVKPIVIEFWQGRPDRLHDRFRYVKDNLGWKFERLAP